MTLPEPNDTFTWVQVASLPALVCRPLEPFARHLFTTRAWRLGASLPETADAPGPGWVEVASALSCSLVRAHQVHGRAILVHRDGQGIAAEPPEADIIVSDAPSVALAIQTADCVPLLMADRRTGAIAAVHAGWRGLAVGVPPAAVEALAREFGSRSADLIAVVGPSIGACCYEIGVQVRERFENGGFSRSEIDRWFHERPQPTARNPSLPACSSGARDGHWYFDAWRATRDQLQAAGVPPAQIHVADVCTASHHALCSYRRDGQGAGRMAGAISRLTPRP